MYSQRDEERVILEYFGQTPGIFLDIGAADGKTFSNTKALADLGWTGMCMEPNPAGLMGLMDTYRDNPNITIYAAAVVPFLPGLRFRQFHACPDMVSSFHDDHRDKWAENQGVPFRDIWVAAMTPPMLPAQRYDMVNIDVEGGNFELMGTCPWQVWQPRLVCIEHDNRVAEMKEYFESFGMRYLHQTEENLIVAK